MWEKQKKGRGCGGIMAGDPGGGSSSRPSSRVSKREKKKKRKRENIYIYIYIINRN